MYVCMSMLVGSKMAAFLLCHLCKDVYNALTLHAMARRDKIPRSPLECRGFWRRNCYAIAGHILSLDDIEHGILRGEWKENFSTCFHFYLKQQQLAGRSATFLIL